MAARSSKRRRTSEAQERFRDAFLDQAADQLIELAGLLDAADADTLVTASAELERMADTAGTLGLGHLERACRAAPHDLGTERRMASLRLVAQALRRTRGRPRIGPILIVADPADTAAFQDGRLEAVTERIRVFPDLDAFTHAIHVDEPSAVVLPMEAVDAVRQLSEYEDFPIFVHGPSTAQEGLAAALTHGAKGFVSRPLTVTDLTRQVRWRSTRTQEPEVLLLLDDDETRTSLARAIESLGMGVTSTDNPADLGPAMSGAHVDAVIMGAEVRGVPCSALASLVRGHPSRGHLPLMVLGRPAQPQALRAAGIDDLMRSNVDPSHIAQRVRDRVYRFLALPWVHQPPENLRTRLGALDALDALLRGCLRTPDHCVAVGLLQVDGIHVMPPHEQRRAIRHLRRLMSVLAHEGLRVDDVVGELVPACFLVAMPRTTEDVARARLGELRKALRDRLRNHPSLSSLAPRLGVSDTSMGIAGVARRAERDLAG